jgi:hypothetical protein
MKKFISLLLLIFTLAAFANADFKQRTPSESATFSEKRDCFFDNWERLKQQKQNDRETAEDYCKAHGLGGITFPLSSEEERSELTKQNGDLSFGGCVTVEYGIVVLSDEAFGYRYPQLVAESNTGRVFIVHPTYLQYEHASQEGLRVGDCITKSGYEVRIAEPVGEEDRILAEMMCKSQYHGTIRQLREEVGEFTEYPFLKSRRESLPYIEQENPFLFMQDGTIYLGYPSIYLFEEAKEEGRIVSYCPPIIKVRRHLQNILKPWCEVPKSTRE